MDSSDIIEDSLIENSFESNGNNEQAVTGSESDPNRSSIIDEVEDSLISNSRSCSPDDNTNYKTPEKLNLDESDDLICASTKSKRRPRILSDSEEDLSFVSEDTPDASSEEAPLKQKNLNEIKPKLSTSEESEEDLSCVVSENTNINASYREAPPTINESSPESSDNETSDLVYVSSDEEEAKAPLEKINLNEMKSKLSTTFRQPTLNSMVQNLSLKVPKIESDGKYFCTAAEYSNQATKVADLRTDALKCRNALRTVNINILPDKGQLLKQRQMKLEKQLLAEENKLKTMVLENTTKVSEGEKKISWDQLVANSNCVVPKTLGKMAMNTYSTQKSLTMDKLKHLHDSLATCPDEKTLAEDPEGLKIELMPHQRRALAWLIWREHQKPCGGILADDMGLGKTLTMISLILQTKNNNKENGGTSDGDSDGEETAWRSKNSKTKPLGGTLVVCPATLIGQWEGEVQKRVKRNLLNVELYHGTKRETKWSRLAKYDIVITTYKLVQGEYERKGPLYNIKWRRVILDEGHVVRNHKAQTSIAVCGLVAKNRWILTGTPVHNKELDLFALLKFLRCSPFDDLGVWKQWVANKSAGGQDRLNTVMTSILLRRTKAQLQNEGALQGLPEKNFKEIYVELDDDEKKVYQKVLLFSRNLFIEFLRQRQAKNPDEVYMRGVAPEDGDAKKDEQYNRMHRKMLEMYGGTNIKSHQILVLLLRLRQICCHPSLIHAILEDENNETQSLEDDDTNIDLFDKFAKMNLDEVESLDPQLPITSQQTSEPESFNSAASKILSSQNPVFNRERPNEKLRTIQKIIEEDVLPNGDKIIIVSQWTTMLQIVYKHLKQSKIKCELLDGSVPVHKRNDLVNCFNDAKQPVKVLLLSLTAGGVGLNLVGANHLLLVDLHWNPQLESQAQDRIYRVGQKKPVFVYKIITTETIEQRIKALQDRKLTMASDMLAGTRATGASKLSLDDLKMLFSVGPTNMGPPSAGPSSAGPSNY